MLKQLVLAVAAPQLAVAFYLPGVAPTSYQPGDAVPLYVNSIRPVISPSDSRLHSIVSYDYYHPIFQFCQPAGGPEQVSASLGSILFGDRIMTSPFDLRMATNESCKALCKITYPAEDLPFIRQRVHEGTSLNWL